MKKTYKKKGKVRKSFRKTLKQHKKLSRKNKRRERKISGGTGSLYAYSQPTNLWEEGVYKFRSSPANLFGGSKPLPLLSAGLHISPWKNFWGEKTAIFDRK